MALFPTAPRFLAVAWTLLGSVSVAYMAVTLGLGGERASELFRDWAYNGILLVSSAICLARGILNDDERWPWLLFGGGMALWVAGEAWWAVRLEELPQPPYPSAADGLWLASYAASATAIVSLIHLRGRRALRPLVSVDAGIVAAAVGALGAVWVADAVIGPEWPDPWATAVSVAYPLCDLALLSLVVAVLALTGWRPGRGWTALTVALLAQAVVDVAALYEAHLGTYAEGTLLDPLWTASAALISFAAWRERPRLASVPQGRVRILAVPASFTCAALVLLVWGNVATLNPLSVALAALAVALCVARLALTFRENVRMLALLRREALTDSLTGLPNRRALLEDLEVRARTAVPDHPHALALFDLDGFKHYNDVFGHPAGDELLRRLAGKVAHAVDGRARAYRMGGDEFCLLLDPGAEGAVEAAGRAFGEQGEGFSVSASYGLVRIPTEARDTERALQCADRRLYAAKASRPSSAEHQSRDVLLKVLAQRQPELHDHTTDVTELARGVARRLDLPPDDQSAVARAAELHDIGKMAIPDAILCKPGPLDEEEWAFMRRHTLIGEEILNVAPSLRPVARLVRASHERWDGGGYPDGTSGDAIPLGARIVAVCDSYSAMRQDRPYQGARPVDEALEELERGAGRSYDPRVVQAFSAELADREALV